MATSRQDPDIAAAAERFMAECEAFCAKHDIALSTLSQRALRHREAISRMPKMQARMKDRMARVRRFMNEIALADEGAGKANE